MGLRYQPQIRIFHIWVWNETNCVILVLLHRDIPYLLLLILMNDVLVYFSYRCNHSRHSPNRFVQPVQSTVALTFANNISYDFGRRRRYPWLLLLLMPSFVRYAGEDERRIKNITHTHTHNSQISAKQQKPAQILCNRHRLEISLKRCFRLDEQRDQPHFFYAIFLEH